MMAIFRTLIVACMLLSPTAYAVSLDYRIHHLTPKQEQILLKTYKKAKPFNLQWSMTAIAWLESDLGLDLVSPSNDYGVFQINLKSYKDRYHAELKEHPLSDKKLKNMLVKDYDLNFLSAIAELKFWLGVHKGKFNKVWGSYNGGYKGNKNYAHMIAVRIKILKEYFNEKEIQ